MVRSEIDCDLVRCSGYLVVIKVVALCTWLAACGCGKVPGRTNATPINVEDMYDSPRVFVRFDPDIESTAARRLWPVKGVDIGWVVHGLRTFGLNAEPPSFEHPTSEELLSVLLDDSVAGVWYSGQHCVTGGLLGVRFVSSVPRVGQSHNDQVLALLGELGMPLDTPIACVDASYCIRDVLNESIGMFNPSAELEWTALALAYYLPPRKTWSNRFGEVYSFDDLVTLLMDSPLDRTSCAGTHVLYALATIFGVDSQFKILSDATRRRVRSFLGQAVAEVVKRQSPDGSIGLLWQVDWIVSDAYRNLLSSPSSEAAVRAKRTNDWRSLLPENNAQLGNLTATSHHLEWMLLLPDSLRPPHEVFDSGCTYLQNQLGKIPEALPEFAVCPYSHAYKVVRMLALVESSHVLPSAENL